MHLELDYSSTYGQTSLDVTVLTLLPYMIDNALRNALNAHD